MRVAIISDTHYGVRNDNIAFMDMTKKFLDNIFFPELSKQNIKHVFHLGDLVDRRKYINIQTAKRLRTDFLEPMKSHATLILTLGNHDCYFKDVNSVNAVQELCGDTNNNVEWYHKAQEILVGNTMILLVPWICAENREHTYNIIKNSNASICMGHLEIEGFEMFRGSVSTHGDNRKTFEKFDLTLSGHYHHRSTDGSICYVGSHGEFTWSDYDDPRGFHILDLETKELTFYENPYKMFSKVFYDDDRKTIDQVMNFSPTLYKNTMVKLIVKNKTNPYWFDMFCEKLDKVGLLDLQIVEDHLNLNIEEDDDIVNEAESTLDIFKKHIAQVNAPNLNRAKLEATIVDLYNNALTIE
jgi:DNA repair exonuclease SbcCD nuclease subunit